eukprot:gnl/Dysnectes_brevis/1243_a1387_4025.p1 GENE.gnl/Dysnectes_brevis/1243_a1387_4025~~gnl/Dysnectes_brevis/1243_a1387_4025.p1  ORF type:complete len:537 (+),score=112.02 gnl/Dysnectes_brevis/1243_a1387_4025:62-1672(+)
MVHVDEPEVTSVDEFYKKLDAECPEKWRHLPRHLRTGRPSWYKRGHVAIGAVGLHICIGSVYAFSGYSALIHAEFSDNVEAQLAFSIAIFFLGISAAFAGQIIEHFGPRVTAFTSAILFPLGSILAGLALETVKDESVLRWLIYVFYGVIGGVGLGCGYVSPVSTLVKWFPDKRGFATGLAVMGFGGGALVNTYFVLLVNDILDFSIGMTLVIQGFLYFTIMFVSVAFFLYVPPKGYCPQNYIPKSAPSSVPGFKKAIILFFCKMFGKASPDFGAICITRDVSWKGALRTSQFFLMWGILFLNIHAGISFLGIFYSLSKDVFHTDPKGSTLSVALTSIANCAGRFLWSWLSDSIGRRPTFTTFGVLQLISFLLLPIFTLNGHQVPFMICYIIIYTTYGGGFAVIPAFISDVFGVKNTGQVHGLILTAWSIAALVGGIWVPAMLETQEAELMLDGYTEAEATVRKYLRPMNVMAVTMVIHIILCIIIRPLPAMKTIFSNGDIETVDADGKRTLTKGEKKSVDTLCEDDDEAPAVRTE